MDNKNKLKKIIFKIDSSKPETVFSTTEERKKILKGAKPFTKDLKEQSEYVADLDRIEDFDRFFINPEHGYEKFEGSIYGIERKPEIHKNGPIIIYSEQESAKKFLKSNHGGYGILADSVGSGKTYEAGVVLSELAIRGEVNSLLIVVPKLLKEKWVRTLEKEFGIGINQIYQSGDRNDFIEFPGPRTSSKLYDELKLKENPSNHMRTTHKPILVSFEEFNKWKDTSIYDLLFDVIIVDEIHELSKTDTEYPKAMFNLVTLMKNKFDHQLPRAIFLTATPHEGRFEDMFKLWYFIRFDNFDPNDFREDRKKSSIYSTAHRRFLEICNNATNVREFVENTTVLYVDIFGKPEGIVEDFKKKYLPHINENEENYNKYNNSKKYKLIDSFLHGTTQKDTIINSKLGIAFAEKRKEYAKEMNRLIASEYNLNLLGNFMTRRSFSDDEAKFANSDKRGNGPSKNVELHKHKYVVNYFFYPTLNDPNKLDHSLNNKLGQHNHIFAKDASINFIDLYNPEGSVTYNKTKYKINTFLELDNVCDEYEQGYSEIVFERYLETLDDINKNPFFKFKNALSYYQKGFVDEIKRIDFRFTAVQLNEDALDNNLLRFSYRYDKFKEIVNNNKDKRILVFFDYELEKKESLMAKFIETINNESDTKLKSRIIITNDEKGNLIGNPEEDFNKKEDAVLVVLSRDFTVGTNLQSSNIIINFEVTPDPIAMEQRIGRIFRLGQAADEVFIYSLADMDKLEGFALMYFSRIGLLTSTAGDAAILSGCNSDKMVTLQCLDCGFAKLIPLDDYKIAKSSTNERERSDLLCPNDHKVMQQLCTHDSKCIICHRKLIREDEKNYLCMNDYTSKHRGIIVNSANAYDRNYHCPTQCVLSHCKLFNASNCPVCQEYESNPLAGAGRLETICRNCQKDPTHKCPKKECSYMNQLLQMNKKISLASGEDKNVTLESYDTYFPCYLNDGSICSSFNTLECRIKPHVISFNDDWEAFCPNQCDTTTPTLKPMVSHNFVQYLKKLWKYYLKPDRDSEPFVDLLSKATQEVKNIKEILSPSDDFGGGYHE